MSLRPISLLLIPLLLAACASSPPRFAVEGVNTAVTPRTAAQEPGAVGQKVLWGGVIVNSSNLADKTQIEVLGYPLDDRQRPNVGRSPSGRFLAVRAGYLETADYAPGRLITVRGRVTDSAEGKVGQADYRYPVVEIEDTQLWAREAAIEQTRPRVNFGIGVMIGN